MSGVWWRNTAALISVEQCYLDVVSQGIDLFWTTFATARNMEIHTGDIDYVTPTPEGRAVQLLNPRLIPGAAHLPAQIFNMRLDRDTADQRIEEIAGDMEVGLLPSSILVSPRSTPDNLVSMLKAHGFIIDAAGMCMALDLGDWQVRGGLSARNCQSQIEKRPLAQREGPSSGAPALSAEPFKSR